jgi:hypothetical protein
MEWMDDSERMTSYFLGKGISSPSGLKRGFSSSGGIDDIKSIIAHFWKCGAGRRRS